MSELDTFWEPTGRAQEMTGEETEAYLRQLEEAYRDCSETGVAAMIVADARDAVSVRPGLDLNAIDAWECEHAVALPATLREALQVQDGGYVRGTRLRIGRLSEMLSLNAPQWAHLWEYEANAASGDPARLICVGVEEETGGIVILDYNG